jgi:carboxylesterase
MGAVLALYLGATVRPPLAGVVALAPPIYLPDWRVPLLPIIKYVLPWYTKGPASPRDPTVPDRLWQYPRLPSESILQMYRLGRETRRLLPRLQVPLLVGRARHDATVPPRAPALVYHYAGSADKTLLTFEHSGHILTEDADRDAVWARVRAFVEAHSPAPAAA